MGHFRAGDERTVNIAPAAVEDFQVPEVQHIQAVQGVDALGQAHGSRDEPFEAAFTENGNGQDHPVLAGRQQVEAGRGSGCVGNGGVGASFRHRRIDGRRHRAFRTRQADRLDDAALRVEPRNGFDVRHFVRNPFYKRREALAVWTGQDEVARVVQHADSRGHVPLKLQERIVGGAGCLRLQQQTLRVFALQVEIAGGDENRQGSKRRAKKRGRAFPETSDEHPSDHRCRNLRLWGGKATGKRHRKVSSERMLGGGRTEGVVPACQAKGKRLKFFGVPHFVKAGFTLLELMMVCAGRGVVGCDCDPGVVEDQRVFVADEIHFQPAADRRGGAPLRYGSQSATPRAAIFIPPACSQPPRRQTSGRPFSVRT